MPEDLHELIGPIEETDEVYLIPIEDTEDLGVIALVSENNPPLMVATSCSVLVQHELPDGWEGLCREIVRGNQKFVGTFSYEDALAG